MTKHQDAIAVTVAELNRRLHGPRRLRMDMVREVRDALCDAEEAYLAAGMTTDDAQARAVADFGDLDEITAEYQLELAARQARRSAVSIVLAFPMMLLLWDSLWRFGDTASGEPTRMTLILSDIIDGVSLVAAAGALLVLVMLCLSARRGRQSAVRGIARSAGLIGLATVVLVLATSGALQVANVSASVSLFRMPATIVIEIASAILTGWVIWMCAACLSSARKKVTRLR